MVARQNCCIPLQATLNLFSWRREKSLWWAFLIIAVMLSYHFREEEIIVPRNLKLSTRSTTAALMDRGGVYFLFLRKSTTSSFVFAIFSSRLWWEQHSVRERTSFLQALSSSPEISPIKVVSSANVSIFTESLCDMQSLVYREYNRGDNTHPWGAPVLMCLACDNLLLILTTCVLCCRKSKIQ